MKRLEPGQVLELNEDISLDDQTVLIHTGICSFAIGKIAWDDVSWFKNNNRAALLRNAKNIVFLGEYSFGIKQLTSQISEFIALNLDEQESVINRYLNNESE